MLKIRVLISDNYALRQYPVDIFQAQVLLFFPLFFSSFFLSRSPVLYFQEKNHRYRK